MPKPKKSEEAKEKQKESKEKKDTKDTKDGEAPVKKIKTPHLLRGFRDILPEDQLYWDRIRQVAELLAKYYSFGRIELPVLEPQDLFVRSVGKQTDIVEKEMFAFQDQSGSNVVLRPEATASVVRAYIEHGMVDRPQPVKMFYQGPMFRHDRPQAGRYRQFHQFGFESVGSDDAIVDAQLITVANSFFEEIGVPIVVHVNSIGTPATRAEYKVELVAHFRSHRKELCDDCKRRLTKNPLRLLDCKQEGCQPAIEEAPQIVDWLDDNSREHFMKVLEYLDEAEVRYVLTPRLVRGLDYYTRTVFEFYPADIEEEGRKLALGGGGRYDGLVELLGGREDTPACGLAIGMERVVLAMKERDVTPHDPLKAEVFLAQLGDAARRQGLKLFETFRKEGVKIVEAFGKAALKAQLELADKHNVKFTLILGQKEVLEGTIIIRDMETGAQETIDVTKVVDVVKKKLGSD